MAKPDTTDERSPALGATPARARFGAWEFRLAVLRHHGIAYRVAYSLLHSRAEAEDAVQEAFLKYWELGGGVRRPREWLLKVTRNECLDRIRRGKRRVSAATLVIEQARNDEDPPRQLEQQERAALLRDRIAALPEPQQSLVVLFDLQGLDGAACARILDLSVTQVKVYLHRARRRLRRDLEGAV